MTSNVPLVDLPRPGTTGTSSGSLRRESCARSTLATRHSLPCSVATRTRSSRLASSTAWLAYTRTITCVGSTS